VCPWETRDQQVSSRNEAYLKDSIRVVLVQHDVHMKSQRNLPRMIPAAYMQPRIHTILFVAVIYSPPYGAVDKR
jgi:hypothetical protein